MSEPYSPVPGVELIGPIGDNRGILVIGGRRWPAVEVFPYFTTETLADGWTCHVPFENGALVYVFAHSEHFGVSLHHQFGTSQKDRWPQDPDDRLPIAGMREGVLDLHPGFDAWQLHYDPEPEWLNWWLRRVGGLAAPEMRRAAG